MCGHQGRSERLSAEESTRLQHGVWSSLENCRPGIAHARFRCLACNAVEHDIDAMAWERGAVTLETQPVTTVFTAPARRERRGGGNNHVRVYLKAPPGVDRLCRPVDSLPALAEGPSSIAVEEVSLHLLTNIDVVRQFLDREIVCEGNEGEPGRVRIL